MNGKNPLCKARSRKPLKGQGLVEYAIILVLVAVVVIVALTIAGKAPVRIFGLVTASLGRKVESDQLEITVAQCVAHTGNHTTTLYVRGFTKFDLSQLSGSTERNADGNIIQNDVSGSDPKGRTVVTGPGTFKYTATIAQKADTGLCPRAVVIQASNGTIAAWPLEPRETDN